MGDRTADATLQPMLRCVMILTATNFQSVDVH